MSDILRAKEVRLNEEAGGRHPIPRSHLHRARACLHPNDENKLAHEPCPICKHAPRRLHGFAAHDGSNPVFYAACDRCDHWDKL